MIVLRDDGWFMKDVAFTFFFSLFLLLIMDGLFCRGRNWNQAGVFFAGVWWGFPCPSVNGVESQGSQDTKVFFLYFFVSFFLVSRMGVHVAEVSLAPVMTFLESSNIVASRLYPVSICGESED